MKEITVKNKIAGVRWTILVVIVAGVIAGMTLLAAASSRPAISITITNNSQWQIRSLYLAVGSPDNWGPDQLNGATISNGGSFTLNNVSCDGSSIRVITEDQNGCFIYHTVTCDANATWTITDSETPDCGS